jgi:hypothetical protein
VRRLQFHQFAIQVTQLGVQLRFAARTGALDVRESRSDRQGLLADAVQRVFQVRFVGEQR